MRTFGYLRMFKQVVVFVIISDKEFSIFGVFSFFFKKGIYQEPALNIPDINVYSPKLFLDVPLNLLSLRVKKTKMSHFVF